MAKKLLFLPLLLILAGTLSAGDHAAFVNLGFSNNSRYFMFGFYGVNEESSPYSEIYLVNVHANDFVPEGVKRGIYRVPIEPGQEGAGAFFTLYKNGKRES